MWIYQNSNNIGFKSEFGLSRGINEIFNYLEKLINLKFD